MMAGLIFMFRMILTKEIIYTSIKKTEHLKMILKIAFHIQAFLQWVLIWQI